MRRGRKGGLQKEKMIMLAASVFVLTALTMTGVYVRDKNKVDNDSYVVDFSKIDKKENLQVAEGEKADTELALNNDMDVEPGYEEANSGQVAIPGVTWSDTEHMPPGVDRTKRGEDTEEEADEDDQDADDEKEQVQETSAQPTVVAHTFSDTDSLKWPIAGNILLNFSMDKTIYFATMEQYKYNPALVIQAEQGKNIAAAADGKISAVFTNEEIGNAVTIALGNGYELTYGQLAEIPVNVGDNVKQGQILGYVAAPTKYYSVEGSNVYFKMTKDGTPVNPLGQLE